MGKEETVEQVEKVVLYTIHKDGKRIGMGLSHDVATARALGSQQAEALGGQIKVWECTEVPSKGG